MPLVGRLFTSAPWLVKPAKETEFVSGWRSFAEWTAAGSAGACPGHLFQDAANSRSFLSFGPWEVRCTQWGTPA